MLSILFNQVDLTIRAVTSFVVNIFDIKASTISVSSTKIFTVSIADTISFTVEMN